ncbi:MAG: L-fuculose-phosphate aldolase [Myxococcota bacterium]|jgi:L-fuculose-phosphate aldolase
MSRNARATTLPGTRRELVHWCRKVWQRGWVANHDGNLTCRLPGRKYLATPTSFSKDEIREDDLLILDRSGKKLQGRWRPFSEVSMHLLAYNTRPDVNAVLHAHPPTATGLSVAGVGVDTTLIAEAVISLGDRIPTVPFALPGSESQLETLARSFPFFDALILGRHGVITVGKDIEQAYLRMELVEHLARIKLVAMQVGKPQYLTDHEVEILMRKRTKGGLGPEAREVPGSPPI